MLQISTEINKLIAQFKIGEKKSFPLKPYIITKRLFAGYYGFHFPVYFIVKEDSHTLKKKVKQKRQTEYFYINKWADEQTKMFRPDCSQGVAYN